MSRNCYIRRGWATAAAALFVFSLSLAAYAQTERPPQAPPGRWRLRLGPLTVTPTVGLTNIGVDQNVFNEPADQNPKSDFTLTFTPQADVEMHFFRTLLTARIREDLVWYDKYASERSVNSTGDVGWLVPLSRVTLTGTLHGAHLRDRPGFEIDARSLRDETGYGGTFEVRVAPKTFLGVEGSQQRILFDKDAVFLNSSLQFELNRVQTAEAATFRYALTPLTSIVAKAVNEEDRFEFSSFRNSNSRSLVGGITFDPLGVISGSATVGYRDFKPTTTDLPSFRSGIVHVNLSTRIISGMRVTGSATRDVEYSFEIDQPYYVQTGGSVSIVRSLVGPVDIMVNGGLQRLAYQDRPGLSPTLSNRVDRVRELGGGIGFRIGGGGRLGFYLDQLQRNSEVLQHRYDDMRFGATLTYGS